MALETTTNRSEYAGNGVTTGFSFPYYFLAEADLKVIQRNNTTGVETLKTLTTHYTITGEGEEAGGTVTMLVAPPTGTTLVIYRDPAITQGTDFRENDSLPAEALEESLDRAAMISQRQSERIDRAVRLSDGFSPDFDPTLPSDLDDAAGKISLINATSDGFADAADWPDVDGVTAGMLAAQAAAEAAQAAAETAETNAELAETNAETAETNAELAETNAETAATLASDWASKTNGQVIATEFSSKAWAIGGTNVTDTASRGAAKEWAIETASTVDGTDYSAKEWAKGTQVRGIASGGSAKDWANYTGGTVDNAEYSSKKYATDAAASAAAAAASLASAFFRDVVFFTSASSPVTIDSTHNGKLLVFDSSGGAIAVSLPAIAGLAMPFNITALCSLAGNNITFTRGSTDVFTGGGTTKVLSVANVGFQIAADTDPATDIWSVLDFGAVGDGTVTTAKLADANVTRAKLAGGAVARKAYRAVTTTDTATNDDDVLLLSGASFTQTIPTAVSNGGKVLEIIHGGTSASQVYTISGTGLTSTAIHTNGEVLTLVSNNTNWIIVNRRIPSVWVAYTPTFTGFGTVTSVNMWSRRVGDSLQVQGSWANGTVAASTATMTFGFDGVNNNIVMDTTKVAATKIVGVGSRSPANVSPLTVIATAGQVNVVNFSLDTNATVQPNVAALGNAISATGEGLHINAVIPIQGWNG